MSLRKKAVLYFVFGFAGAFLAGVIPIADSVAAALAAGEPISINATGALVLGVVAGAFAAGARALVALLPVMEADNHIGLSRD